MSHELFGVTPRGDGVVSLCICTDDHPYLETGWIESFADALARLAADTSVRAVVLEGGHRYFQAGASRAALLAARGAGPVAGYAAGAARALLALPVPVVAAAAGHAIGGGLVVALWCDAVVLAEESLYGANFMALGFTPGMGATHAVPEAFGEPLGRELLYTGRLLTGTEIRESHCPLSHAVRPRGEVLDRARRRAHEMVEAPRASIVLLKRALAGRRREALERAVLAETHAHELLSSDPTMGEEISRRYPTPAP